MSCASVFLGVRPDSVGRPVSGVFAAAADPPAVSAGVRLPTPAFGWGFGAPFWGVGVPLRRPVPSLAARSEVERVGVGAPAPGWPVSGAPDGGFLTGSGADGRRSTCRTGWTLLSSIPSMAVHSGSFMYRASEFTNQSVFSVGGLGTRQRLPVDAAGFGCGLGCGFGFGCGRGEAGLGGTSEAFAARGAAADAEDARLVAGLPLELDLVGLDDLVGPAAFEAPAVVGAPADLDGDFPRSLATAPLTSVGRRRVRPAADDELSATEVRLGDLLSGPGRSEAAVFAAVAVEDAVAWGFLVGGFFRGGA